jgi:hypothetical protein
VAPRDLGKQAGGDQDDGEGEEKLVEFHASGVRSGLGVKE